MSTNTNDEFDYELYEQKLKERKNIRKKTDSKHIFVMVAFIALGAVIGMFAGEVLARNNEPVPLASYVGALVVFIVLIIISFVFNIILHEAGHMAAGLMTGYRFLSFRIFSLVFIKKDGKIITKKFSIAGTGGQCLMYPPKKSEDGSFPYIFYNLGGCMANFLFAALLLIPAVLAGRGMVSFTLYLFSAIGFILGLTNIIPMGTDMQNDGKNLVSAIKNKTMRDALYFQLDVNARLSDGAIIHDIPEEEFILPEGTDLSNMLTGYVQLLYYYRLVTDNRFEDANRVLGELENAEKKMASVMRDIVECERLQLILAGKKPIEEIAAYYFYLRKYMLKPSDIVYARTAYFYALFLSPDKRFVIESNTYPKEITKYKPLDSDKTHATVQNIVNAYPVAGEAAYNMDIIDNIKEIFYA